MFAKYQIMKNSVIAILVFTFFSLSTFAQERDWEKYPHDSIITFQSYDPYGINDNRTEMDSANKYIYTYDDSTNSYTTTCYGYHSVEEKWYKQWIDSVTYNKEDSSYQQAYISLDYTGNGDTIGKRVTSYNDHGLCTDIAHYNYDSLTNSYNQTNYEAWEYNDDSLLVEIENTYNYDSVEQRGNRHEYEYNDYGDVTGDRYYYYDDTASEYKLISEVIYRYEYDENGNTTREVRCEYRHTSGWNSKHIYEKTYNRDGDLIEAVDSAVNGDTTNIDFARKYIYTYYEDSVNEIIYNKDSMITSNKTTEYVDGEETNVIDSVFNSNTGELYWINYISNKMNYKNEAYEVTRSQYKDGDSTISYIEKRYYPLYAESFDVNENAEIIITFNDTLTPDDDIIDNIQIENIGGSADLELKAAYVDATSPKDIVLEFDRKVRNGEKYNVSLKNGVYSYDNRRAQFELSFGDNAATATESLSEEKLSLYPTVTNNTTTVFAESEIQQIKVVSQSGILCLDFNNISNKQHKINTEELATGIYTVQVTTIKGAQSLRLVVQ